MKKNLAKPPSPKGTEESHLELGLLILAGLVLIFAGFKASGIALVESRGSTPLPGGYLQVMKSEGYGGPDRDYILEMPSMRMKMKGILPGLKHEGFILRSPYVTKDESGGEELWLDSGDAVRINSWKRRDMIIHHLPQGMDNRTRYVLGEKMNLNSATAFEMSLIRGLGIIRAERIVAAREDNRGFTDWDELRGLPEVSDEIFIGLRGNFFLGEPLSEELKGHVESAGHPE